jgi:hypothetical protein
MQHCTSINPSKISSVEGDPQLHDLEKVSRIQKYATIQNHSLTANRRD